jgi:hypothetical protein
MRRPLRCERGRQLRSHTTLARRHYKQTVETRFLYALGSTDRINCAKPSVAQNLLLHRPAPVAHITVGSHPDKNEIGRNVLIHCRRVDFV